MDYLNNLFTQRSTYEGIALIVGAIVGNTTTIDNHTLMVSVTGILGLIRALFNQP